MRITSKIIASLLSASLFLTNGAFAYSTESNLWESRRATRHVASLPAPIIPGPLAGSAIRTAIEVRAAARYQLPAVRNAFLAVPRNAATVRKVLVPAKPNGKVVLYIQDVHGNNEAQSQISTTLSAVSAAVPLRVLALEGATGPITTEPFRQFPAGAIKTSVGNRLVRDGLMSGAIMAAWNTPRELTVVGIDSEKLHKDNVDAYLNSRARRTALHERLIRESTDLAAAKDATFNRELRAFDVLVQSHRDNRLALGDFARELQARRGNDAEINKFVAASKLERSLDFKRVENERKNLLEKLVSHLNDKRSNELVDLSLVYRSGQIRAGEFNAELTRLCEESGVRLTDYPEMSRYLTYVRASDDIDAEKLSDEISAAEEKIYLDLSESAEERRLIRRDSAVHLTAQLLDFALSRTEWREYKRTRGTLTGWDLASFENFYVAAEARDKAMTSAFVSAFSSANGDTAALVTGGFHSRGIERRLTDAGYSVIQVTPRLTHADSASTLAALSVFSQEKTPLEKIFDGGSLFLAPHPLPLNSQRIAGLTLSGRQALEANGNPTALADWLTGAEPWNGVQTRVEGNAWFVSGTERKPDGKTVPFDVKYTADGRISKSRTSLLSSAGNLLNRLSQNRAAVVTVRVLIETIILLLAQTALHVAFPGFGIGAQILTGLVFAAVHPEGRQSPLRFLALALLGAGFTHLLSGELGFAKSFFAHLFYNAVIIAAIEIVRAGFAIPLPFAGSRALAYPGGSPQDNAALRLAPGSSAARVIDFISRLPLAMVRKASDKKTRGFMVGRTNSVDTIVKATVLKIDGTPKADAPRRVYPVLSDDQIDGEIKLIDEIRSQWIDNLDFDDGAAMELYEKIAWVLSVSIFVDDYTKRIRQEKKPARQAIREAAQALFDKAVAAHNEPQQEWGKAAMAFADVLDERAAGQIDVEAEVKKVTSVKDEASATLDYDDAEAIELYEKQFIWFLTATRTAAIIKDIRDNKRSAEQAVRLAAQALVSSPKAGEQEWGQAGLELAKKFAPEKIEEALDPLEDVTSPVVLVVRNPDYQQMLAMIADPLKRVAAVVLEGGYESKHWSAFLAQSRGIPVLGDLRGDTTETVYDVVENGDVIQVDAINHHVTTNPSRAREAGFERALEQQMASVKVLSGWGSRPGVSVDGVPVRMSTVLSEFPTAPAEFDAINNNAGGNVGLFRTEFLYTTAEPYEPAQQFYGLASKVNGYVRIRAIDRRPGDKNTIFDTLPGHEKAELHWLLETETGEKALRGQIRALLTAQSRLPRGKRNLEFFVPMVEKREQAEQLLKIVAEVKAEVRAELKVADDDPLDMTIGVMIETPVPQEELDRIISLEGIGFVSIGTRDMADATKVRDVIHPDYINALRSIIMTAAKYGKDVGLCGEHTSNEMLFLVVNSMGVTDAQLPSWAVVPRNIARMKAVTRAMNRKALIATIKGGSNRRKIEKMLRIVHLNVKNEIRISPDFEKVFNDVLAQEAPSESIRQDFDETSDRSMISVAVKTRLGRVPVDKANRIGYDYSLINPLGRHVASSLKFVAQNGNRGVAYLARLAQNWVDRLVFARDTRQRWTIVGAEGHRPGKDPQGTLPVGSQLGFGNEQRSMLLLSMESPDGLSTGGGGTVMGRIYGEENAIQALPDAYMFKIVTSPELATLPLDGIIQSAQDPQNRSIDLTKAASDLIISAQARLGRKPRIGVLLRDRQRGMIEAIARGLGIKESYDEIHERLAASIDGQDEFKSSDPDGGTLYVYSYDDWSGGLAIGQPEGMDLFIGTGGSPEAAMSAGIAKKQGAPFAAVMVPQDNVAFTPTELANLERGSVTDLSRIYHADTIFPGDKDSIAVGIAILRDFRYGANLAETAPGPKVADDGRIEANVLWVSPDGVMPVNLTYTTTLAKNLRKSKKRANDEEAALATALGWAEFGGYEKALALANDRLPKAAANTPTEKKWRAIQLFAQAGMAMTRIKGTDEDAPILNAIDLYDKALAVLSDTDAKEFEAELLVGQKIRRLHYLMRDRFVRRSREATGAEQERLLNRAVEFGGLAMNYTTRGYETRRRQNNARLDNFLTAYDNWEASFWAENHGAPNVRDRLEAFHRIWMIQRSSSGSLGYADELRTAGTDILTLTIFATVLKSFPIDDQARILRFVHSNPSALALADRMLSDDAPTEVDFAKSYYELLSTGLQRRPWQSTLLEHLPAERRVVRPDITQFLPRIEMREDAGRVLAELLLTTLSKADIMPALGNADRREAYLRDAAHYAEVVEGHPRLYGANPLPLLFEIALLYDALATTTTDTAYQEKARAYGEITGDTDKFKAFLAGLQDESGRRLYSDADIIGLNDRRQRLKTENDLATEKKTGEDSTGDGNAATVNSLPYYLALVWNRIAGPSWQIPNPARFVRIGYLLEIAAGLALISFAATSPWASHALFFFGSMPMTGLPAVVFGAAIGYAALHAVLWAGLTMLDRRVAPREILARLGLHTLGFLPYVAFALLASLDPSLSLAPILIGLLTAAWHAGFDEKLSRGLRLTDAQAVRYNRILDALHARESPEGTLSRRIDTILPTANTAEFNREIFQTKFDDEVRAAAAQPESSVSANIDSALEKSSNGPILVFISANGPSAAELTTQAFERAAAEKTTGPRRPVLISVDPDVPNAEQVVEEIQRVQNANPATPSSVMVLNRDVQMKGGEFHYEDLFAAFAADARLQKNTNVREMLEGLAQGRADAGTRIVQINSSAQPFVAKADLLALILLIVPIRATSILLDLQAVVLASKQA